MKKKSVWIWGALVFMGVFSVVAVWKWTRTSPEVSSLLAQQAHQLNLIGYVGSQLLWCVDDNLCPASYDPQSALGLMPYVQMAEDQVFAQISKQARSAKSLSPMLGEIQNCQSFCSCVTWGRFLESSHGQDFNVDLAQKTQGKTCPRWSELSGGMQEKTLHTLKHIESLQE